MNFLFFLDATVLGVLTGFVYALISTGIALIFGVTRVVNFAHSEMFMLAGYVVVFLTARLSASVWLASLGALLFVFALGYFVDHSILRTIRRKAVKDLEINSLVATMGVSIFISNTVFAVAGSDYFRVPGLLGGSIKGFTTGIPQQQALAGGTSLAVIILMFLFLRFTKMGMAIRAVKDQPAIVEAFGIDRDRVFGFTFGIASALAGVAGLMVAPIQYIYPYMGATYLVKAFVISVMAGLGSMSGVLLASIILGVLESWGTFYFGTHAGSIIFFATMVLCLIWRPYGLLGRAEVN